MEDFFQGRILLAEDDPHLAGVLTDLLLNCGYWVMRASDGVDAVEQATGGGFDLLLLDLSLPRQDGFAVCEQLRARGVNVPILVLTGWADMRHRVDSLRLGADDYMTKPYEPEELLARIQAMIRRARWVSMGGSYHFGEIEIDLLRARVTKNQAPVELTAKELLLLQYLLARRGCAISRSELLAEVWGYRSASTRTVDVHVANLRRKLEDRPAEPAWIVTVPRAGYMIRVHGNA